jgi:hypothetical protein
MGCQIWASHIIGLVQGTIYRKPWFLPLNIGVSCNFSRKRNPTIIAIMAEVLKNI